MAGIRRLVSAEMVENDNDAEMGTHAGAVEEELLSSYFVRRVYLFRYPTACFRPRKYTCCACAGGTKYANYPDFCVNHQYVIYYVTLSYVLYVEEFLIHNSR